MFKKHYIISNLIIINVLIILCFSILSINTYASSSGKTIIGKRSISFADYYADYDEEDSRHSSSSITVKFTTKKRMIFAVPIKITIDTDDNLYVSKGGIRIILKDKYGSIIQNDFINLKNYRNGDVYESWFYSDGFFQPAGQYTYTIKWTADEDCFVDFSVVGYTKFAKTGKLKKSVSKRSGNWVKIGKISGGLPHVKYISIKKKKIAPFWDIDIKGNIYVYCKSKGNTKVTVKLKNGKKYSCNVKVKPGDPNFYACLYDYETRDNCFVVKVYNPGPHSVTLIKNGAKVKNVDYKSFDRNIKSGKSVTIKPGKTKKVRFYVRGSNTWYDSSDFTLYAKFRYEGKVYDWHVWDENTVYRRSKDKWYGTYFSELVYKNDWLDADE